jgi:hypothetical protein
MLSKLDTFTTIEGMQQNRDELVKARINIKDRDEQERHYIMTEMVRPLIDAVIVGGVVEQHGTGKPFPVLYVEQGGKRYTLVISADDEMNEGGRVLIDPA